jgi:hypothetical protein
VIEQAQHLGKLGVEVGVLAPHHQGTLRQETIDGVRVHRFRYMLPERWQTLCYGAGIPLVALDSLVNSYLIKRLLKLVTQ